MVLVITSYYTKLPPGWSTAIFTSRSRRPNGEGDFDRSALAEGTGEVDGAAMPLHNPLDDGHPEPHAPLLGGEEGVPYLAEVFRGDAGSGVADPQNRLISFELGGDLQPPSPFHGLHAVEEKVKEDLLELLGVGVNHQPIVVRGVTNVDALLQALVGEQRKGVVQQLGEPDGLQLQRGGPGEVGELLDDGVDAVDFLLDDAEELLPEGRIHVLLRQVLGEGLDGGERVLDLVRHAGGELAGRR